PPPPGREDAPRGDIEERVAALWRDRLGLEFVGRHDDFLELGGNSLTAAQLLNQLRDAFGVNLPLAALFEAPTVAGIAGRLEPLLLQAPQAPVSTELPLVPLPRDGSELQLSFVQERVWRLEQHLPGLSAYNLPFVLRLEGDLDADVMERGIQEIVQRHEALRTTYDTVDGRPVQRFHPHMRVPLTRVELRGPLETREPEALRLAREDAAKPFDLVHGPVLRTTLVRLDAKRHLLISSIHHIVSDTMSIALLVQELGQLYDAFVQGKPSPLKPLPLQYADFGAWQRRGITSGRLAEQDQGWRQRLSGMPRRLDLPTDRPRSNEPIISSQRMTLDFPPALAHELVAFTRREGFTGYMTVLAAWQTLLHRYSGQTDVVVGTPIANRTRPELMPLIGYVAHSEAFRTRFTEGLTFRELLAQVRGEVADAQTRPDVPFEYLVEALIPGHDIGRGRMTDSVFVYHTGASSSETLELIGLRATLVEVPGTPVQWGSTLSALTLVLFESPTRVHGALEYASDLFDAATTARLMEHFQVLLGAALANPDTQVAHLPLATDDERRAWPTPRATPGLVPVPTALAERRARHAGATALSQGETHWTWAELGARADALAARLKALGVKAGTPVAVCLRTSPEKLAALWAVLAAGGACVALGPSDLSHLPVYALEGAPVPVLVTTRALVASVRVDAARVVYVEDVPAASEASATVAHAEPHALAWLLPTGRGQPAWALGHRELAEFFTGLDTRLSPPDGGAWLAASEPSSDRPELEALWALTRGLRVVFPPERITARLVGLGDGGPRAKAMDVSLIYFANDEDTLQGPKYELLLEGAKFADANGFSAVWTPERHFHSFGGLYPQPAVVAAGLATVTKNLRLRSGSVVLPLHDPLLIAEQWSVVDNLSQGRVGLSVATGWHTQDFTFAPANYEKRRDILLEKLSTLRALWRGERFKRPAGAGSTAEVGLRPKPVQKELPVWLTATGNPETFRMAGELGAGVLTGLMSHTLEELKQKVALYRDAWRRNGHPGRGHITCMLHTYLGDEEQEVLRTVRQPLLSYFRSSVDISTSLLQAQGITDVQKLSPDDINAVLERTFENHAKNTGLLGTVDSALRRLRDVRAADVDEVAALIDFGLDTPVVLEGLRRLATVRERMDAEAAAHQEQVLVEAEAGVEGLLELARQSGAVLLHTSARLARSLSELPGARESLSRVGALVLEGASVELGSALHRAAGVEVWLSGDAQEGALLPRTLAERIPANLQAWVLDAAGQPVPVGVVGELALAGAGLPSALWRAGDEEHRRLVPHPREASAKLFRTGRHARLRGDGRLEPVASPSRLPPPPVARPAVVEAPRPVAPAAPAVVNMSPPPIPRVSREQPLPLSFAQQRLWYLQQMEPTSSAYNNPAIFRLKGDLDRAALQAALDAMVVRHEVLRTTYALEGDHAVQVIHPPRGLPLQHWDVPGDTPEAREAAMRAFCQDAVRQPFDLEQEVLRAALIRLGAQEHVLLVTFHHAVSDAWCTLVIAQELTVNYTAFRAGQPSPLPELPVQYADYAVWQRAWLEGGVMEKQVAWWKDHLTGAPPLDLPTDRPRPAVMSSAGARHTFLLPTAVSAPLLALGRKHGATSFMVLMALFQTALSRYSGQDDFVVGTPIAGRTRPELEWLMGCFINTLPFRSRLSGQPSFVELLGRVRTQALEAYAHQDAPFERVLDSLDLPRDLSRTPLFQVSINVVNMPEVQGRLSSLELTPVEVPTGTAKFDLGMEVVEVKDGFNCGMEYATALFDAATMERLARHMVGLAREVVAHPQTPVALLPLMDAAERQRVLVEWNDTFQDFPQDARIPDLFARQAAARPDAVAVESGGERLTYAQLDARANQWAHVLREHGVGPDVLVAVCLERSLELVVALLAAVKAGGAYLPLDPSYPAPRLAAMLEDAPAKVLLTTRALRAAVPLPLELPSVFVEELAARDLPTAPVVAGADSRHLAYVDFTSGSTGRPKGVAVDHRAVMRLLHHPAFARMSANETFLQLAPISFDPVTLEVWGPLLHGGRLVMFPPTSPSDLDVLAQVIQRHGVTSMMLTAGLFTQVADLKPEALTGVRQLLVGGDVVSPPHVRKVLEAHPGLVVTAGYGPTEATLIAATHVMTEAARVDAPVPLGRPIARTDLYVLDARGQPVPPGIPGELHIGGEGLARGYISRPDLTAERFIPHPFSSRPGERLYRTGDLTRWRADGTLDFLGRTDHQVKVRGFRIELSEVESALGAHPNVRETVAVVREDVPGDKRLVAYVVAPSAPEPEALRDFMRQRVPDYMLPSAFVLLESLPLTAQGKVDRKALPAPEGQRASRREYVAPRTPREQALAQVMAQVLRVERVGLDDNFFELGGDSIISLQVVAKARQAGVRLQVKDLFQHPTLGALAAVARDGDATLAEQGPVVGDVPLTPIQVDLFEREPTYPHHFNHALLLKTRQPLKHDLLQRAVQALVAHHDALRLRYVHAEDGTWRQESVAPESAPPVLLQVDLSMLPPEARGAGMEREAARLQADFALATPPLVRVALFHFGAGEPQRLLLIIHHLVVDAVSWRILVEDLETAYLQLQSARAPALPAKTTSFLSWAQRLEKHALSEVLGEQESFWREAMRGDVAPLPVDGPGPYTYASRSSVAVELDAEETRQLLQETPTGWRARIDDVLLTALGRTLGEWTGKPDVLIELEGHGREELFADVDVSRTVGWFTSVAPALLRLPKDGSLGEGLRAVRDSLKAWPGRGIGFNLLRHLGPPETRARLAALPKAQVSFNYLGQLDGTAAASTLFTLSDEPVGPIVEPRALQPHALAVDGSVLQGRLRMTFGYSHQQHHEATVRTLAERFLGVLRELIAQRHSEDARRRTPGDFPLARLSQAALDAVLAAQGPTVEDVFPLSPLQEGMLFHALNDPEAAYYFEQAGWSSHSDVDIALLQRTWQTAVDRNPILRTAFVWEGLESPLQVVHSHATLPFIIHDWRHLPEAEQPAALAKLTAEDRARGFDVSRAPLSRMTVVRLGESRWRFLWSHHHLLMDGWSMGLFFQEVFALYDAVHAGTPPPPMGRPPFRDYIAWLDRRDLVEDERFWRDQLTGLSAPTPLPSVRPASLVRPSTSEKRPDVRVTLPAPMTTALESFARRHQLTLNTLTQAAWALVLARHADTRDVLFGTTLAGRPPELPGADAMLGLLITTQPVRITLPGDGEPVLPWLQSLQAKLLGIQQHQYSPLVSTHGWSDIPRGQPLFQSLFVFENYPFDESVLRRFTAMDLRDLEFGDSTNYPLSATVIPREELQLQLVYDAGHFDAGAMQRVLGQWRQALEGLLQPDARIEDVSLLPAEDRAWLLRTGTGDAMAFERDATLHARFERQAAATPDANAVVFGGTTLTFRQLNAQANQLAWHLRSLGVGPEVTVGLCLERSAEAIVALLAVLKAGGAFVPVDPSAPAARKSFVLKDGGASVLVTTRAPQEAWNPEVPHLVRLDAKPVGQSDRFGKAASGAEASEPVGQSDRFAENLPPAAGPANLAYVIYTSGSTGTPKGVMVQHRSVLNLHQALTRSLHAGLAPGQRVTVNAPLHFDASIAQVVQLLAGHCLHIVPEDVRQDAEAMVAWLEGQRIDVLDCTPSQLRLMLASGLLERAHVPGVISVGGEAVDESSWRQLRASNRTRAFNEYGPTECTVDAADWRIQDAAQETPVIGRPLANLNAYVLDGHQRLVPLGTPGELCLGGEGITRGYLGRPDLTAERFVPDPFSTEPGARLYRTGDKARWREDGTLEYLGRLDFQVKLRGYRIELGEIEAALRSHPDIRDAVVLVREDRLIAWIAPQVDTATLRQHLRRTLPDYMVPAAFVVLDALPQTPNGKVDRDALPSPEAAPASERVIEPPSTPTEVTLASLWSEVLRVPAVGRHDGFFELGGHSLLATQLVSRVRARFGMELPLRALLEGPTVAELARRIDALQQPQQQDASASALPSLVRAERPDVLPLSFAQQRMWFVEQLGTAGTAYSISHLMDLDGSLDVIVLLAAFDELVRRHEALRTTFQSREGTPSQVIHPPFPMSLRHADLSALPTHEAREAEVSRLAREESSTPFDLEQGPLFRGLLMKLGATKHVLLLNTHHIVTDGWSTGVLVREMGALYAAFAAEQPSPLPELTVQFADHALWQRAWFQGEVLESQVAYWRDQLDGAAPYLELPTDHPRPSLQGAYRAGSQPLVLSRELSEAVEAYARQASSTPFMVLLTAFQLLLHRYSGQEDVLVGSPIAGRRHAESESLIGYFANTVVLRTRMRGTQRFRELLDAVRATTLGAYEHQDLPFEKLVEVLQPERDLGRTPLFQVTFTLQNAPMPELALPGLTLKAREDLKESTHFDLQCVLARGPDGFEGVLGFNQDLFDPDTVAGMVEHLRVLLESALRSPDARLPELPWLTRAERQRLLSDWSGTSRDFPRDASVASLFTEQAARTPDATALKAGERRMSYAALDRASNQLAHHLRRQGVRPGHRVGLCVERSFESITALIGILKAGAAYVPVDPQAPAERIAWVLREAGVSLLVTEDAVADELPAVTDLQVLLDADAAVIARQSEAALDLAVSSEALAYVMFTSGSTGRPKGVSVPHRGITRLVRGADFIHFGPEEVFLHLAPIAFDASTLEVWGALLNGATLVVAPAGALSLGDTGALLRREGITTLWLTAALFEQMVLHQGDALARVRQVLAGGDVLPVERVREHLKRLPPGAVLVNGYGPTENTTFSATHTLRAGDPVGRSVPIGRPLSNSTAWVLDATLQPVPPGVPGTLYVGGDGLAWGYLQRPDLTAERFIPHPFAAEPGARLYDTGDRVRWLRDGTLEFLGRADFQVKLRGFRIELGEIEAVLRQSPEVEESVAVVREDVPGDKRLVAYVVSGEGLDTGVLRAAVQKQLPDYMVPSAIVVLPKLPMSPNGKVDRKALPAPKARVADPASATPRSALEKALADIWAEVLHLETVDIHGDFFELGGHSLLATQVVARIRSSLGLELPLGELFRAPTVASLAERLVDARRTQAPPLVPVSRTSAPALSFAQQRLWFVDQLEPGSPLYNMPLALSLTGDLDVEALRGSLDALMARHESLRTTFRMEAGKPVQDIHPEGHVPLELVDLTGLGSRAAKQAEAQRQGHAETLRPFDLTRGPVIRALLMNLDAREHVLVLHLHHIVSDGWSLGVLVRELTALYAALRTGQPVTLSPLPVQYADYAVWQRGWLQGGVLQAQVEWWKQQLSGAPFVLDLPTDRPRTAGADRRGGRIQVSLPRALSERVEALAQAEGTTPFMALLAAFQAVLSRTSGQDDVLVGSPIANRRQAETEGLIGFFVNMLVLRGRFSARTTFRELLAQMRATTLGAYEHQDIPFEHLVEALQPERDLGRTPLFQAMFALQNAPLPELAVPGLIVAPAHLEGDAPSQFELALNLSRSADGYEGHLGYAAELFDTATIERLFAQLRRLLEAVCDAPDLPLADVSLVSPEELVRLVRVGSGELVDFERDATLHGLIERQVARTPDAPAVVFEASSLTYRQLDTRANQLAWRLRSLGVGPEVKVALCLERSVEAIVALLAVLKAGGAFVPLDPSAPAARRDFVLKDSGAAALVTTEAACGDWSPDGVHEVWLDVEQTGLGALSHEPPPALTGPEHLAYVLYTSGSTGTPKGVMVQHRTILNMHRAFIRAFYAGQPKGQRVTVNAPLYFDAVMDRVVQLIDGHCLHIVPDALRVDPEAMLAWLDQHRIDSFDCTPAQLKPLLAAGMLERAWVPPLVMMGGDALDAEAWRKLAATDRTRVFNGYGPTECTVCTAGVVIQGSLRTEPFIGRPVANLNAYVLDARQRLVPFGTPGELCFSGESVTRGYLGRPDLTAERFVPDPFSAEPGARIYRTGDKGRWRPDGTLEFMGRLDFQVKLRGYRIELGEIEATLRTHSGVRDAVALVREDVPGDARLVAYVVAEGDTEGLREHLRRHLPEYMVPSAFVALPALPLTPNGKVDRKALPSPEARLRAARSYEAPATPAEVALASLWEELLNVPVVGRNDHFFELGGHSILATQLVSRIRARFGVDVGVRALFESPTVAALAQRLPDAPEANALPPLRPAATPGPHPLSFAQQRLWFIDQLDPGSALYNMPTALRLSGAVDVPALQQSFDALVERHEALRTTFEAHDGEPRQHVHPAPTGVLSVVDLTGLPDDERETEAVRLASEDAMKPFDLAVGPLARLTLLKLGEEEHVLLLCMHHAIGDGWSMSILVREVTALYEAFRQGQPSPLAPLPVQYPDFAVWQRGWLQGEVLDAQLGWWTQQLAGAPQALALPTDKPRPPQRSARGATFPVRLSQSLSEAVEALAQREGATPFMLLLAAFQTLLHRYSGQEDLLVGTSIAGRRHAETEGLIGFFVNTLVLRARFDGRPSFRQLLSQVRATTLGAYEHQDIPFERLVEAVQPARDLSRTPLIQALFALQNLPEAEVRLPELTLRPVEVDLSSTKFDLDLSMARTERGFEGALSYATDLFEPATARRLSEHFLQLLEAAVTRPDAKVDSLPLLTAEERQWVLEEWSGETAPFEVDVPFHARFEQQVTRTPKAPAVVMGDTSVSFHQLNVRANQLAHYLRSLGVGPDVPVAFCLERSPEAIVTILGILKAGGAYVPLDPAAPEARKAFILENSGAAVLVTTQAQVESWQPPTRHVVRLDADARRIESSSPGNPRSGVRPEHLAYVIYTSGSTGAPKGVMIQHRSLAHLRRAMNETCFDRASSRPLRVSVNAPYFFDASVQQLSLMLDGHCLFLVPETVRRDPETMLTWVEQHRIDLLDTTPSQFQLLLEAGLLEREHVPSLCSIGGEAMDEVTWRTLTATDRTWAFNAYGPTEITVNATIAPIQGSPMSTPVIGRPLLNLSAYVLDANLNPVSVGIPGELYIGGEGLARGYRHRPDLTAERFIPHPFSTEPGARMYRTGDRVRWMQDGTLEYLGRVDFQVKLRGYRIELGEIEAALRASPGVRDATVLLREDVPGLPRLVAYVTPEVDTATLRGHLQRSLPEYMVPAAYVALPVLPLTPNGKVDRKALPVPVDGPVSPETHVGPRNEVEARIAALWAEALGVSTVDVRTSFFELGGHSLLAVRLMAAVHRETGRKLPLSALFQAASVERFAVLLGEAEPKPFTPLVPFTKEGTGSAPPFFFVHPVGGNVLAYAELARRLGPDQPFYGIQARGLDGTDQPLDTVEALAASYVRVVRGVQPHGPYHLGGWSLGGVIAYEMAHQLREAGEAVELVAMIDSYIPETVSDSEPDLDRTLAVGMFAQDLMGVSLADLDVDTAELATLEPEAALAKVLESAARSGALPPGVDATALFQVFEANLEAARRYHPPAMEQRVVRFQAEELVDETGTGDGGWAALVGDRLESHRLPGTHYTLLRDPVVQSVAELLMKALRDAGKK
ncbi:non-ribosomal peptide synthase/polyketide synthase, partial [Corallococcus exiguus]|uniref:non-ribosomal peptide synthase/polyketide synthase n=1 Tax=Corallococcus exiguus TaxID=83462 RepID=UPI00147255E3